MTSSSVSASARYRWLGRLLAIGAGAFLLRQGWIHRQDLLTALEGFSTVRVAGAWWLYAIASLLLSLAWPLTLRGLSYRVPLPALAVLHLQSQLAKYLPGGVFHFAQRHGSSLQWGLRHTGLVAALAIESLLLVGTASLVAAGVMGDSRLASLPTWVVRLLYMLPLLLPLTGCGLWIWSRKRVRRGEPGLAAGPLLGVFALNLAFFLLSGLALVTLGDLPGHPASWLGWLAMAWICGYLIPGAPGGLGIREGVLMLGLADAIGSGEALALAIAYRAVTLTVDAACTAAGYALARKSSELR